MSAKVATNDITPAGWGVILLIFPGSMVAFASSDPWILMIAAVAGVLLVFDVLVGRRAVNQAEVAVSCRRALGRAGDPLAVWVEATGPASGFEVTVDNCGPTPQWEWSSVTSSSAGVLTVPSAEIGEYSHVRVAVRSTAPLGLIGNIWVQALPLDVPLAVGPQPMPLTGETERQLWRAQTLGVTLAADDNQSRFAGPGDVIGVKPYQRGDRRARLHWPSSARTGQLMVRETEAMSATSGTLLVEVASFAEMDNVLGAAHTVGAWLARHDMTVRLVTVEWSESGRSAFAEVLNPDQTSGWRRGYVRKMWESAAAGDHTHQARLAKMLSQPTFGSLFTVADGLVRGEIDLVKRLSRVAPCPLPAPQSAPRSAAGAASLPPIAGVRVLVSVNGIEVGYTP